MKQHRSPVRQKIDEQIHKLLSNGSYALKVVVILGLLPMMSWLSVFAVALYTLHKCSKEGALLAIGGIAALTVQSVIFMPLHVAIIFSLMKYIPCFIGALFLKQTGRWQVVFSVYFFTAFILSVALQTYAPQLIIGQYKATLDALQQMQPDYAVILEQWTKMANEWLLANFFCGFQIAVNLLSATFSLVFARAVQARLYNPGLFQQELKNIRADRLSLLALMVTVVLTYLKQPLAVSELPILLFFFALCGVIVAYQLVKHRQRKFKVLVLFLPLILLPSVMIPVFILFGAVDSIINLRLLFPNIGHNNR